MDVTNKIRQLLFSKADPVYADFQAKLTPGVERESIIGVRMPILREIARKDIRPEDSDVFMQNLPHRYYDEYVLHSLLISQIKSYDRCLEALNAFLPHVDNWAVCDVIKPKALLKNRSGAEEEIGKWIASSHVFVCRFGIKMLMDWFLDDNYKEEQSDLVASVRRDDYYVNMMIAWYFATALAKRYDSVIGYLEKNALSCWTHNKTIQKAIESYRISPETKDYLRGLKRS